MLYQCGNGSFFVSAEDESEQEEEETERVSEAEALTTALGLESEATEEKILGKIRAEAKKGSLPAIKILLAAQHNRWLKHIAQEWSRGVDALETISWSMDNYLNYLDDEDE